MPTDAAQTSRRRGGRYAVLAGVATYLACMSASDRALYLAGMRPDLDPSEAFAWISVGIVCAAVAAWAWRRSLNG